MAWTALRATHIIIDMDASLNKLIYHLAVLDRKFNVKLGKLLSSDV